MPIVHHQFLDHQVSPNTRMLMLGTFNPAVPAGPDFFYGRPRNYLWQLLPGSWGLESLKHLPIHEKLAFMEQYRIDFADLIESVDVPQGEEANVDDTFIDESVEQWKDVIGLIDGLERLQAVYFTRKTFTGIPNIHERILAIRGHCNAIGIRFCLLVTPARFANARKQHQWTDTIVNQIACVAAP